MRQRIFIPIVPMGAPRMNRSDAWEKRPVVLRYRAFRDNLRMVLSGYDLIGTDGWSLVFRMPMPPSWSLKKRFVHNGKPHRQKPDIDNLWKAFTDAVFDEDSGIWQMRAEKRWAFVPGIEINFDE